MNFEAFVEPCGHSQGWMKDLEALRLPMTWPFGLKNEEDEQKWIVRRSQD